MSYDLMVFEPAEIPRSRNEFMAWYNEQVEWSEDHSYDDPAVASQSLQTWFHEMMKLFPPMNGPFASDEDNDRVTDYCIGKKVIYSAFAWSVAEEAHKQMRMLAVKHKIGFFDVNADNGEILFPFQ